MPPGVDESQLGLFFWTGDGWALEPTGSVDPDTDTLVATPDHFSLWAVLAKRQVHLLAVLRASP